MAALHRLGADLGDPIEVTGSGDHILVTGVGIAPERQQEIRDELKAMPRVTLLFPSPSAEPLGRDGTGASSISVRTGGGPWQAELEKQLGGRAAFEQFSDRVLQLTDAFMSRAYALRRLAQRFPSDREAQMTPRTAPASSGPLPGTRGSAAPKCDRCSEPPGACARDGRARRSYPGGRGIRHLARRRRTVGRRSASFRNLVGVRSGRRRQRDPIARNDG